ATSCPPRSRRAVSRQLLQSDPGVFGDEARISVRPYWTAALRIRTGAPSGKLISTRSPSRRSTTIRQSVTKVKGAFGGVDSNSPDETLRYISLCGIRPDLTVR